MTAAANSESAHQEVPPAWQHGTGILLMLADLAWLTAWYRLATHASFPQGQGRIWLAYTLVYALAYFSTIALDALRLLPNLQRGIALGLFALGLGLQSWLLAGPSFGEMFAGLGRLDWLSIFILGFNLFLWRRAMGLSRSMPGPIMAWGRLRIGILMLAIHLFVVTRLDPGLLSFAPLFLFLLFSLMAMVTARVSFINQYHGSARNPFDRKWVGVIGVSALIVSGVGALAGGLLTGQFAPLLDQLAGGLGWLARALAYVIALPVLLLAYLLEPLIGRLEFDISLVPAVPTPELPAGTGADQPGGEVIAPPDLPALPEWLGPAIVWAVVILGILLALSLGRRRLYRARLRGAVETEAEAADASLFDMLRLALRQGLQEALEPFSRRLRGAQRARAAARIRQIYAELLDLAEALGRPRQEWQTPLEYIPALAGLFPEEWEEIRQITAAYLKVRYGELPETQAEVDAVEAAWRRLAASGEGMKKSLAEKKA